MKSDWKRNTFIYLAILLAVIAVFSYFNPMTKTTTEIPLSQLVGMTQNHEIKQIEIEKDVLNITANNGTKYIAYKEPIQPLDDVKGIDLTGVTVNIISSSGI